MWLDADDVIEPADREKIIALKKNIPDGTDIVTMRYNVGFDENGNPTFFSTRGRLFRRAASPAWQDPIHEYVPLSGRIYSATDIYITHRAGHKAPTDRNLKVYESMVARGEPLSPRSKYYYARELKDHLRFAPAAEMFKTFLDEGAGWVEDNIAACFNMALCLNALNQPDQSFAALIRSFTYDAPRPETCCMLAYHYKSINNFRTAAAWFETALNLPKRDSNGFVLSDYHTYIPALELAVCYDKMEDYKTAARYNEIAGTIKPASREYLQNKAYFEGRNTK
jgi:tetratricopeptide (TPR) repeat protein